MHAPAAERNADALLDVLQRHAPGEGRALELASGTGQHVALFARALSGLIWQPSEVDATRLASIEAWRQGGTCENLLSPIHLNATQSGWGTERKGQSLILVVNLLHLISRPEAQILISEASQALHARGKLVIYGPFLRDGSATSAGDRAFDAQLRAANPEIGYKDDNEIEQVLQESGFDRVERIEMPANNLVFVAEMG